MKSSSVSKVISRSLSTSQPRGRLQSSLNTGFYNSEQVAMMDSVKRLVEEVINPNWQEWQTRGIFPAHQVFKKFGEAGLLGIHRDREFLWEVSSSIIPGSFWVILGCY